MEKLTQSAAPVFECDDLDLAAFLIARGFEVQRMTMVGGRAAWTFEACREATDAVLEWTNRSHPAMVDARAFSKARTSLYRQVRDALRAARAAA